MSSRISAALPLSDQVYEALVEEICSGAIKGGERLRQEALAERLGVSRQPVQQAMVLLRRNGLVRQAGRQGVEVVPLDKSFVNHLYDMRLLLDLHAVRHAAPEFAHEAVRLRGYEILEQGKQAAARHSFPDIVAANAGFHAYFYELTNNPFLMDTARLLSHSIRRVMTEVLVRGGVSSWVCEEHEQLLDIIVGGDVEAAVALADAHIGHGRAVMLENLADPVED
jgi:DNA-binding GntR family transcriptional regulator